MESTIMLQPGTYYVGDLGFVLPNDDLRMLFAWRQDNALATEYKRVEESVKRSMDDSFDMYWIAALPQKHGTLYDADNTGWGFDWGCFGVLPWKWVTCSGSYEKNKIDFAEPFVCSFIEDKITIGNLQFTFNPK